MHGPPQFDPIVRRITDPGARFHGQEKRSVDARGFTLSVVVGQPQTAFELETSVPCSLGFLPLAGQLGVQVQLSQGREGSQLVRTRELRVNDWGLALGMSAGFIRATVSVDADGPVACSIGWGWPMIQLVPEPDELIPPGGFFEILPEQIPEFAVALTVTVVAGDVGPFGGIITWIGAGTVPPQGPSVGGGTVRKLWMVQSP